MCAQAARALTAAGHRLVPRIEKRKIVTRLEHFVLTARRDRTEAQIALRVRLKLYRLDETSSDGEAAGANLRLNS